MRKEVESGQPKLIQENAGMYSFENLQRKPGEEQNLIDEITREAERLRELDKQTKAIP